MHARNDSDDTDESFKLEQASARNRRTQTNSCCGSTVVKYYRRIFLKVRKQWTMVSFVSITDVQCQLAVSITSINYLL